ncbi:MAG: hypothetical protein HW380_2802 [Magnetococcales bacterium]|nr:hypothetical protein [Magnetococcales bacterium]HIJ83756.1 hypothetical protein [Magnetococcales bacterium]
MAERDLYTAEQLAKIRATLQDNLGDGSTHALENLDARFVAKEKEKAEPEKSKKNKEEKVHVDVGSVLEEANLKKMLAALQDVKDNPQDRRTMVAAIIQHKEVKAFHLVEALSKVPTDKELVDSLVHGITSRKGVNPLIDALRHAEISPTSIKSLAKGIAEQGTINHIIRAIATAPSDQPEAEIIWAMEVIGKGTMEQILEAFNLLNAKSPGTVILATGLVNRKEVAIEPLVRALTSCKDNAKASAILSVELTRQADLNSLVTLLEKYIGDSTAAGEIIVARLVFRSLIERGRTKLLAKAARFVKGDSMAGKILAMGIVDLGDAAEMEKAFPRISSHPVGQKIVAVGLHKKIGGLKALRLLGGAFFKIAKFQDDVSAASKEARARYNQIVKEVLGEDPNASKVSAREKLTKDLGKEEKPEEKPKKK